MVFTYDPGRIFVEVLPERQLVVTTLDVEKSIPLIRYRTGDMASLVDSEKLSRVLEEVGGFPEGFPDAPLILVYGRGKCASAGEVPIYPEEVKEGLYEGPGLARLTTANFRIKSGETRASVRIQLAPGIEPETGLDRMFADALRHYVHAPMDVKCQSYEEFGSGMALDYERKFSYLEG